MNKRDQEKRKEAEERRYWCNNLKDLLEDFQWDLYTDRKAAIQSEEIFLNTLNRAYVTHKRIADIFRNKYERVKYDWD